jgi:hypothetical protein
MTHWANRHCERSAVIYLNASLLQFMGKDMDCRVEDSSQ